MTIFFLIRHGTHELQGRVLVGRRTGLALSCEGRQQAADLARRLGQAPIAAVYSSPLERALDTAAPLADRLGTTVIPTPELTEIDFGDWTGQSFDALAGQRLWRRFNSFRSGTCPPNGESMLLAQARVVGLIDRLCLRHPDAQVALVSHGDVIRSALLHFMGVPLDLFQRIEIGVGSFSILAVTDDGPQVLRLNELPREAFASGS